MHESLISLSGKINRTDFQLNMASVADIDNVQVPFLHINQLIENKKFVDRPKDKIDII